MYFSARKVPKAWGVAIRPHPPAQAVRGTLTCAHTLRFAQARSVFIRKPPSDASRRLLSEGARLLRRCLASCPASLALRSYS